MIFLAGPVVGVAPLVRDFLLGFSVYIHADLQRNPSDARCLPCPRRRREAGPECASASRARRGARRGRTPRSGTSGAPISATVWLAISQARSGSSSTIASARRMRSLVRSSGVAVSSSEPGDDVVLVVAAGSADQRQRAQVLARVRFDVDHSQRLGGPAQLPPAAGRWPFAGSPARSGVLSSITFPSKASIAAPTSSTHTRWYSRPLASPGVSTSLRRLSSQPCGRFVRGSDHRGSLQGGELLDEPVGLFRPVDAHVQRVARDVLGLNYRLLLLRPAVSCRPGCRRCSTG